MRSAFFWRSGCLGPAVWQFGCGGSPPRLRVRVLKRPQCKIVAASQLAGRACCCWESMQRSTRLEAKQRSYEHRWTCRRSSLLSGREGTRAGSWVMCQWPPSAAPWATAPTAPMSPRIRVTLLTAESNSMSPSTAPTRNRAGRSGQRRPERAADRRPRSCFDQRLTGSLVSHE